MLVRRRHVRVEIEQKTIRISTAALVQGQHQTSSSPPNTAAEPKPLPSSDTKFLLPLQISSKD